MPSEIEELRERIQLLENKLLFIASDRLDMNKNIFMQDGRNFQFALTNGTKIGTSTSEKFSFYNSTPIVQPSSTGETSGFTQGSGNAVNDDSDFGGGVGSKAYRISDIVKHLKNLGLLAAS